MLLTMTKCKVAGEGMEKTRYVSFYFRSFFFFPILLLSKTSMKMEMLMEMRSFRPYTKYYAV